MKITTRRCAYSVLYEVAVKDAYVNLALQQALRTSALDERDKALCSEIVYGTVKRQRTLDVLIGQVCNRAVTDLEASVLTILRMSVYQLAFLDKVPVYAVLNEAVELAKQEQRRAAGFVNGVLRSYVRDKRSWRERVDTAAIRDEATRIGVELSYPTWLVKRLFAAYGKKRALSILQHSNQKSHLSVRVNTRVTTVEKVLDDINNRDGLAEAVASEVSPVGLRLMRGLDVERWSLYQEGKVSVQDEAAMLIAPLLQPSPGQRVLDMCAAPGSKTAHIAELMDDDGAVTAADIHPHKVKLIAGTATRLHLESIQTMAMDARLLPQFPHYQAMFDSVLLDAPCSGLGVLRHRPDIRWRRKESDIAELAKLQVQLLEAAVEVVKPGGVIVYATCTLLPEENQQVVADVLARHSEVTEDSVIPDLPKELRDAFAEVQNGPGFILTPDVYGTDGFFMCRIRKNRDDRA
ncbi:16S rRNA (cytosine(967)-C(5))-methyltransferase RsmB [Alicyclobacillus sp. SO9]|uniref:16S rRNA (cytosine(967)-C(5))-methyltransferase RsmB n=1 Tax=Alicyclobacillus sp. SO9 TaxID=2665646 RepID=UPI0018E6DF02|nr:16S rRNA (cytosine(967)-C(5))-methyltransferase RsmB [Alicyclobacillus sp. SO9]QQE80738.1 16S rRNA (cytosine(967)-C(5))-methyltransferase RsmB [Alicyclobacillus sp. SO9]